MQSQFDDAAGALSPDEKWLAHSSDQTGRREAYVRPLAGDTGRWQISTQGGWAPRGARARRQARFYAPMPGGPFIRHAIAAMFDA